MLKRISVEQLSLGMYIHELCGSWMDHPFLRGAFLLDNHNDLKAVLTCGISEVWIDTDKGLDVENWADENLVAAKVESMLHQMDTSGEEVQRVDIAQEAALAAKVCAKAKRAVFSMFQEARMGKALSIEGALPIVKEISDSVMRNPGAMISLARLKNKDDYTYMHSVSVCALMVSLARQLKLDDDGIRQAGLAGLLHDIGKMKISTEVLNKPGKLTDDEFALIKSHPVEGHKILSNGTGVSEIALDVCLHHHEKVNGSGYPDHLKEEQISIFAKMGAVCDVYDAVTSNRPYKNGWEPAESIRKMAEWSGGHFDPVIFHAFVKNVGIYPIGSLVRLESNRLGVVIEQTEKSLLTPKVKVFFSIKSNSRIIPETLDLSKPGFKDKIASYESPEIWKINDIQELWSGVPA
jgi:putative nucleotidyltransferase with HDIG domain